MYRAALDFAEGRPVTGAPPSLRVYVLAKRQPGMFSGTDLLDGDGQLLAEFLCYAAEQSRVEQEEAARERARGRSSR